MKPLDKVVLFGICDGFGWSTLAENSVFVMLDNGDRVEVPEYFVKDASEFVEKDKMKLKDVIARIKKLDIGPQKVWLDEILNALGSDYGTLKYKDGYEQGKFEGSLIPYEEPKKVKVPQIVADYIKYTKDADWDLQEAMDDVAYEDNKDLRKWFNNNIETFVRAWLDGYEIEQEKRYLVKMKGVKDIMGFLNFGWITKLWFMGDEKNLYGCRTHHTRRELEEAGFGEVFNSPLFEVEEVEE